MSNLIKVTLFLMAASLSSTALAQGKIAILDLQEAILQTDLAQKRITEVRGQDDYKADKKEFDELKSELDELVKKFQKDAAVMSQEQQVAARQKLASKQADLEHVGGKLQKAEAAAGQALLQEMAPKAEEVLKEIIANEGIGLLLQRQVAIYADPGFSITAKLTDKLNQATN